MSHPSDLTEEELFDKALSLPVVERLAFLRRACAGNASLVSHVEALLRAHADGEFLENSPAALMSGADSGSPAHPLADELTGTRIGRFKILERIGEGGCGIVYLTEQEEPIRRRVALKVIKLGMDTREVITRFEAERQALAMMEHPNIARVFDCGATAAGRPYFVMELVRGPWITSYCDNRRLSVAARMELFIPVCRAIQHAHERGVVHRDIKPSNILVAEFDGAPVPKVIDFGVAKAVEVRLTEKSLHTGATQFIGTPVYMSPEQAELKAGAVDARSDVYSLGALLYELLAGRPPFAASVLADSGFDEMRRRIREDDPTRPSAHLASLDGKTLSARALQLQLEPSKLKSLMRGDLDNIVMHCLEKDPGRRYATAAALAEDIARHLRHEPVRAAKPSLGSTLRRLARRHRAAIPIVWVSLAALGVVGAGARLWFRTAPRGVAMAAAQPLDAAVSPKSVAVLPFENLSPDPANAFFADGMHEDVITDLTKIHDLKVISHASVMAYKTGARNLRQIAAELGVANIIEGSVERVGNRVRVTAQLVDARTDRNIWADSYDRDLTDEFAIQSDLAQRIAGALRANLTPGERQLISRTPTLNQRAYDLYLRARALDESLGDDGLRDQYYQVVDLLGQAVAADPGFALAYVQLSLVDSRLYWYPGLDPTPARLALAKAAAEAAERLAPDAPETKVALGCIAYSGSLDWKQALAEFQSAETAMPNDSQLLVLIGIMLKRLDRWNDALGYFERAAALDPGSEAALENCMAILHFLRRDPEVVEISKRSLRRFPDNYFLTDYRLRAQYEIDGDSAAFLRGRDALHSDRTAFLRRETLLKFGPSIRSYFIAVDHADWAAAENSLSDPRIAGQLLPDHYGVVGDPIAQGRAMVAFLRGQPAAAGAFGDQAIEAYRARSWVPRQKPWLSLRLAQAEAYAGHSEDALRDAQAAWNGVVHRDAWDAAVMRPQLGLVYLTLDRREEALSILRTMMTEPCDWGPRQIRADPFWSRLENDPRFEEILRSAKPLQEGVALRPA